MGIFDAKRKVSPKELKTSLTDLRTKGFSKSDIENIKKISLGSMVGTHKGIDAKDLKDMAKWARKNKSMHTLSEDQITQMEESFREKI